MNLIDKLNKSINDSSKVYDMGYSNGKTAEHDAFWDSFQANGARTFYAANGIFCGRSFDFSNFYPKYDIRPVGSAQQLFYAWEGSRNHTGSLKERLEECGVVLDTSQATSLTDAFSYTYITELPVIDCRKLGNKSTAVFSHAWGRLKTIEKIIVAEDVTFTNWFLNTPLNHVIFEGVIGNDLDLGAKSTTNFLDKESIESIVKALSGTATGKTLTLSQAAVKNAFKKEHKNMVELLPDPDENGFYAITLPDEFTSKEDLSLKFSTKMNVQTYIGYKEEDSWGNINITWDPWLYDQENGVEHFVIRSETSNTCYYYMIKRTDGEQVLEEDIILVDGEDLSDWEKLIAEKNAKNWTFSLQ